MYIYIYNKYIYAFINNKVKQVNIHKNIYKYMRFFLFLIFEV